MRLTPRLANHSEEVEDSQGNVSCARLLPSILSLCHPLRSLDFCYLEVAAMRPMILGLTLNPPQLYDIGSVSLRNIESMI